jgi:hypothetical protein
MHLLPCEPPYGYVLHPFRRKNAGARILDSYVFNDTENIFREDISALLNKNGLTLHQSVNLLERLAKLERIDEMEQRAARRTTD